MLYYFIEMLTCVFYTHHDSTEDQTMLKCSPVSSIPIMIAQKIRQCYNALLYLLFPS